MAKFEFSREKIVRYDLSFHGKQPINVCYFLESTNQFVTSNRLFQTNQKEALRTYLLFRGNQPIVSLPGINQSICNSCREMIGYFKGSNQSEGIITNLFVVSWKSTNQCVTIWNQPISS